MLKMATWLTCLVPGLAWLEQLGSGQRGCLSPHGSLGFAHNIAVSGELDFLHGGGLAPEQASQKKCAAPYDLSLKIPELHFCQILLFKKS